MNLRAIAIDLTVKTLKNSAPTGNYDFIHTPFPFTCDSSVCKISFGKYTKLFPRQVQPPEFRNNSSQVIHIMLNSRSQK